MNAKVVCDIDHRPTGAGPGSVVFSSGKNSPEDVRECDIWVTEHQSWYPQCILRILPGDAS